MCQEAHHSRSISQNEGLLAISFVKPFPPSEENWFLNMESWFWQQPWKKHWVLDDQSNKSAWRLSWIFQTKSVHLLKPFFSPPTNPLLLPQGTVGRHPDVSETGLTGILCCVHFPVGAEGSAFTSQMLGFGRQGLAASQALSWWCGFGLGIRVEAATLRNAFALWLQNISKWLMNQSLGRRNVTSTWNTATSRENISPFQEASSYMDIN